MRQSEQELAKELRLQWKRLWHDKIDDKIRAEGIAVDDYNQLFIEKGTIIHATRDYKDLKFKEILYQHKIFDIERYMPCDPSTGGLTKFIKNNITNKRHRDKKPPKQRIKKQQLRKKNGRGWMNI